MASSDDDWDRYELTAGGAEVWTAERHAEVIRRIEAAMMEMAGDEFDIFGKMLPLVPTPVVVLDVPHEYDRTARKAIALCFATPLPGDAGP